MSSSSVQAHRTDQTSRSEPRDTALLVIGPGRDGAWQIISIDGGPASMLGYHPGELLGRGRPLDDLVDEDDRPELARATHELADSDFASCLCRLRTRSGAWHRAELRLLVADRDSDGSPTRVAVSLYDADRITNTQSVLALHTRVLELIARGARCAEVLDDLCAQTERFVPNAVCSVMTVTAAGPLRVAAGPSLPPEAIEAFGTLKPGQQAACCGTAVYTGKPVYVADIRKDDRWETYRQTAERFGLRSGWSVPIRNRQSEIIGSFGICRTVPGLPCPLQSTLLHTASSLAGIALMREALERDHHKQMTRFLAIFETARDAIFLKDTQGHFLAINPAMAELLDLPVHRVIGRADTDLFDDWSNGFVRSVDERVLAGETVEVQHARSIRGRPMVFDVIKVPLRDEQGEIRGICGIARDITERVHAKDRQQALEERVQRAARLERLGLFAGSIAHDFGNIILGIRGNTEILRRTIDLESNTTARDAIQRIDESVNLASDLTGRLLAYTGRGRHAPEPIDATAIVRETVRLCRPAIPAAVDLNLVFEPGLPTLRADPVQLRQVVMNLVTNAADAIGPASGNILVHLSTMTIEADTLPVDACEGTIAPGQAMRLDVVDDGPGIPDAHRHRVFEPFYSTKDGGRGLGLAAVLGTVQTHAGAICIDALPEGGTRISVFLPIEPIDHAPSAPTRGSTQQTEHRPDRPARA